MASQGGRQAAHNGQPPRRETGLVPRGGGERRHGPDTGVGTGEKAPRIGLKWDREALVPLPGHLDEERRYRGTFGATRPRT